jgi:5-deoxy-glucuronate isomerase
MKVEGVEVHAAKQPGPPPPANLLIEARGLHSVHAETDRAGWRYLSFHSLTLEFDEAAALVHDNQEAVLVVISGGGVRLEFDRGAPLDLIGRENVFSGLPWAAYIPRRSGARIVGRPVRSGEKVNVAYGQAPPSGRTTVLTEPVLITPDDVEVEIRGAGHATRQVNNMVMPGFGADRLMCCEVLTPGGNWSGWPAHRHDYDQMPDEAVLEESYFYQFQQPAGWAIARLYDADRGFDAHWTVRHGDVLLVTRGYHPFAASPGYDAYYLNFLAGDRRTMQARDDPQLAWVRGTWPSMDRDPRVPLVGSETRR